MEIKLKPTFLVSSGAKKKSAYVEQKKYFKDHQTANAIQLFVPAKRKFLGSLLFQSKSQWRGILQGLLDKYSHLFICISLKWALSSGQKPVCTVKILVSGQIAFAAVLYFGQVFVFFRLINESELEWFLLIMCKWHTLTRSTNLFSRKHPTYFVFD